VERPDAVVEIPGVETPLHQELLCSLIQSGLPL
jgi:hypothetical protein